MEFVQRLRKTDMRKAPSISETLDWAHALVALNAQNLDKDTLEDTLSGAIVLNRHAADGAEVTHFRISGVTVSRLTGAKSFNGS